MSNTPIEMALAVRRDLASLLRSDAPSIRRIRRHYSRAVGTLRPEAVYRFVWLLLASGQWSERVVAYEILASHPDAFKLLNERRAQRMAKGLSDWGSVDLFGVTVLGQAWRDGLVSDSMIHSWATSSNRWRRRLALVSTVPLNSRARGGKGDATRTLRVCSMLVTDRDDMVVKAMSWALRELAKRDPKAVKDFISSEASKLAPRVKREVLNKLRTGRKSG